MAKTKNFATRTPEELAAVDGFTEKSMLGGGAFLLGGNMAVGIMSTGDLMVRVGPDGTDEALAKPHTRLFEMRGRSMTGWVIVALEGVKTKRQLAQWVRRGTAFAATLPPKG